MHTQAHTHIWHFPCFLFFFFLLYLQHLAWKFILWHASLFPSGKRGEFVPKRRQASKWTCFVRLLLLLFFHLFIYLFIYVFYQNVIQMEGWAFAWQRGWGAEREPQGETVSINRRSHPPPHLQYSSYGLTNAYIAQHIPTTLCAKYDNKGRRAGCLYCYFSRDKTIGCLIATAQQKWHSVNL